MTGIDKILEERGKTHGDYSDQARMVQAFKRVARHGESNYFELPDDQKETIDMILHKLGRVLTGDPNLADHWDDIAGYATLSANRVRGRLKGKEDSDAV